MSTLTAVILAAPATAGLRWAEFYYLHGPSTRFDSEWVDRFEAWAHPQFVRIGRAAGEPDERIYQIEAIFGAAAVHRLRQLATCPEPGEA
jgi:hypothetical protein